MAGYRQHISFSGLLGVVFGFVSVYILGFTPVQGALAGILCWVSGMLPDLDSSSGRPVRELFSLLAAIVPLEMMGHFWEWGGDAEGAMLIAVVTYIVIRYGGAAMVCKMSVHRGMFHSIPAMIIAAELAFLGYRSDDLKVKCLMAAGVAAGFLSHLLLDEIYAVQWTGVRLKLNKAAGSAMKMFGKSFFPTAFTYCLLIGLTYTTLLCAGMVEQPDWDFLQQLQAHLAEIRGS